MTEHKISAGNPWAPPALEAVTVPFECKPETNATSARLALLLFGLLWGGFAVVVVITDRGTSDWIGVSACTSLSVVSFAASWAWPRLIHGITVTADGLIDSRAGRATRGILPWSEVESITPVPGVADSLSVRFTNRRSIQLSGPEASRRAAIEGIYVIALPALALRLVEALAAGETVHFAPWPGGVFEPRRESPRGLWLGRDGIRVVTWWRESTLAWRDVESIEWRGFGRAVLHGNGTSVKVDGHFENASALLAIIPEVVGRHREVCLEATRPPSIRWYAGLYAVGLAFGALLLFVIVAIYAPSGRILHSLGVVLRRAAAGNRDLVEVVAVCFGSMLPYPLIVHVALAWEHWRRRRRGPQPTSLWTGPEVTAPPS